MPSSLNGKTVLITGASRGIGRACAVCFADKGADLVLTARSENDLEATRDLLPNKSARVLLVPADITDINQVKSLFQKIESEFGRLDILINNAGRSLSGAVDDIDLEKIEQLFRLNFFAPLWCIQEALPLMKKQKGGQIINVSSIAGKRGVPFSGAYCASKAALNGLTESLRVEVKRLNIKVLLVCPAGTDTNFYSDGMSSTPEDFKLPTENLMPPETVAREILSAALNAKGEIVIGLKGRILVVLSKLSHSLTDVLLGKVFRT